MKAFFDDLAARLPVWMDGSGPGGGIVLSTRARLARNLRSFPFPYRANDVELGTVLGDVKRRLSRIPLFSEERIIGLEAAETGQQRLLLECGLASPEMLATTANRAVALAPELDRLVLVNEENHLHLVGYRSGFDPAGALADVLDLDSLVEKEIEPAFDAELGYLTANPAGVGTGLRLSAHVHLPGLVLAGEIEKVCNALTQLQFKVEGLFGKGRSVRGSIFQISNLVTLGLSEEELANDFKYHVGRLIQHERAARQQLISRDRLGVQDMTHRNLAVLLHARLMTSQEAVDRLSHVRLGLDLGLLQEFGFSEMNEALYRGQAAHLEIHAGRPLEKRDLAAARADFLRKLLDPSH
jgi:protein arginine kinase